jgi:DNA-binding response OmpR family regulator
LAKNTYREHEIPLTQGSGAGIKTILVVEDERTICEVCRRALGSDEFEVDIAVNGIVDQGMLGEKHYDLCLIDIRTLEMNGMHLYEFMKEKHPEMVNGVIFTTAYLIGGEIEHFLELAGRPFLPKPFTLDKLRAIVRETLGQMEK